jgi:membrane protease YdiL (CAAX protease family)
MSLVVYILQFLIKSNYKLVVTIAILFSSFLFGLAHLPLVVVGIGIENLTLTISSYVIGTNMLIGIVLGIVYYKSSIEAAMLSHILAHVFLILVELVIILS